jgi:xylan 1,4-beta-xylosidase
MRPLMIKKTWMCIAFLLFSKSVFSQVLEKRQINADINVVAGPTSTVFNQCIGAGRANEGLRADWQQQLAKVQKDINFKYIRFHGLLHDDMRVYTEDKSERITYNWQYIDKLFDFLLSIKIRPFVEFGFMPADLAAGTKTIFWWKANVSKPKDYVKWDALITGLVKHWQDRYGEQEVRNWYFEVWNEPDLKGFFDGTESDYFELYTHTAKAVKGVSGAYKVGGPATSATKWIADFLSYCEKNKLPLDFVSTHDYGTTSVLDELGTKKQQLKGIRDTIAKDVKHVKDLILSSSYKNAELHFTEWNSSPSSRDPIHDTYQNAAYVLHVLKKASGYANSMSYWTFTDIFEEAGPAQTPFYGGFGLINLQDIPKPTFYAYSFMNQLGKQEIRNSDESSYICKSAGGVQVLLWDYTQPSAGYSYDQDYFSMEQPSITKQQVKVKLKNLKNGKYQLEIYRVGYAQSDPYTAYIRMGKPSQITRTQTAELRRQAIVTPYYNSSATVVNGLFEYKVNLKQNDIFFLKLIKIGNKLKKGI